MGNVASRAMQALRRAQAYFGIAILPSATANPDRAPTISAGSGLPGEVEPDGSLYLRTGGSTVNEVLYVRRGGSWEAVEADSSGSTFTDGSSWFTTDTLQGLADAVVAAIGGTAQGTRAYSEENVLTDDQTVVASLEALDLFIGDLVNPDTNGEGASLVGIEDAAGDYSGNTVEAALVQLASFLPREIADPGDAGAIPITRSAVVHLVTAGAETRTVADPTVVGLRLGLTLLTDGGDCTVTFASPVNETGNNTLDFRDVRESAHFVSVRDGASTYRWELIATDLNTGALSTV